MGAVLLAGPVPAESQQGTKVYRIGVMIGSSPSVAAHLLEGFRQGLQELGWVEGKNIELEIRAAEGNAARFPGFAAELVRLKVDVIVATVRPAAAAAKTATTTIPIVMVVVGGPVEFGLVASLARPGGNITGLSLMEVDILGKQLQTLKEAIPKASRISVLYSRSDPRYLLQELEGAAPRLGIELQVLPVKTPEEFDEAFATMIRGHSSGLLVTSDYLFFLHRKRVTELAAKAHVPAMYAEAEYVRDGGLMSYAPSFLYNHRRAAVYVDKILKGAKPADLPIEQPTTFEFLINLRAAKALGLTIPPSLLARADQVIE